MSKPGKLITISGKHLRSLKSNYLRSKIVQQDRRMNVGQSEFDCFRTEITDLVFKFRKVKGVVGYIMLHSKSEYLFFLLGIELGGINKLVITS
jgi:hypothetical protein